jgi:exonuclease VII small subunit
MSDEPIELPEDVDDWDAEHFEESIDELEEWAQEIEEETI